MPSAEPMSPAELARDWRRTVRSALGTEDPPDPLLAAVAEQGDLLVLRWSEPHRRYHDLAHLSAVLTALDQLTAVDAAPGARGAARLAAWFHDAVYAGRPGADEEASAVLAEQVLPPLGVRADLVAEVARLVRLTTTHDPADHDVAGALLVDADLAVLASTPPEYAHYTAAIRAEYAHVPEPMFRLGRAHVLKALLDKPFLYRTPAGRRRWEAPARANLTSELATLTGSSPPPTR